MTYQVPPPTSADPDNALGRRVAAGVIDVLILLVVMVAVGILFGETVTTPGSFTVNLGGLGTLLFGAILFLYYFLTEWRWQRSPGKAALGLTVVGADGGKPNAGAIALRTLLRFIDWLPFFYLVGFISVLATGKRERLGDLAAKTRVVRIPQSLTRVDGRRVAG